MSLFSPEYSGSRSQPSRDWSEALAEYPFFCGRQQLESAFGATIWDSPVISPLPDAGADDSAHIWEDFAEAKELKEGLVADALIRDANGHCLGDERSEASSTELSPNEVFVFNIKYSATKAQLESLFSDCGAVASISLPFDEKTSRIKGYAFIAFERDESVKRAIEQLNGFYLNGRPLCVRRKTECKSPSARSLRPEMTKSAIGSVLASADAVRSSAVQWPAAGRKPLPKSRSPTPAAIRPTKTVFMGNISLEVTHSQIWKLFAAACGNQLKAVRLVKTDLGMPRGFGYVDFHSEDDATRALSLNGHVISGRVLRVNYAEGYQPDYAKNNALRVAASTRLLFTDARHGDYDLEETPPLPAAGIRPIDGQRVGYFPFVQVPRGYALVPIRAVSGLPVAARRASPHMFRSATDWPPPVSHMLPTDVSGVQYYARQPLAALPPAYQWPAHESNHLCVGGCRVQASVPSQMHQF